MLGTGELIVVLVVVLLVFGAGKVPELGDGLGKAIRNFKRSLHEDPAIDVTPRTPAPPAPSADAATPPAPPEGTPPRA